MKRILSLAFLAALALPAVRGDTLEVSLGPEFTISQGDASIEWMPFLSYVNGSTIVAFSEHADAVIFPTTDGMRVSFDGGATWPTYVQNQDFYCSSVIRRLDGSLFATSYITQEQDATHTIGYHWVSFDNGQTWTPQTSLVTLPQAGISRAANWGSFLFHRTLIQMADGSIQGTMYGAYVGDKLSRVLWVRSDDQGATWNVVSTVAYSPTAGSEGYDEPCAIQAADGSLLVVMRTGSASYPLYQTRSTDGGLTWSAPTTLPGVDPSVTYSVDPDLTMMSNGTLVLAYGRPSTNLLFSLDGSGYNWSYLTTPVFSASNKNYLGVREITLGKLLVVADNINHDGIIGKYVTVTRTVQLPPSINAQPSSQIVAAGSTVVFSVAASGSPAPTYQWLCNGGPIPADANATGATSARLVLTAAADAAGTYTCVVTNALGVATSSGATLALASASADSGRLVNLSILSQITGSLTMGFITGPSGATGLEPLLIRAIGPAIGPGTVFAVPGVMPDPTLTLIQQSSHATVAMDSGWGANASSVATAEAITGAFPLTDTGSADSALVASLPPAAGGYSVQVEGKSGDSGTALAEVYDATSPYSASSPHLTNLSSLTTIAPGGSLTVGFVAGGSTAKTFLIRASGPSIAAAPFNVSGTMPDPQLSLMAANSGAVLAADAGWGGDSAIAATAASLGAFSFVGPASLDSAVLVTLSPGSYTVGVTSASGAGGTVLVEVYEVP